MTSLDANILVRYFAQDDPIQSGVATEIIEDRLTEADPGFISLVAIAETMWVLQKSYRLSDLEIARRRADSRVRCSGYRKPDTGIQRRNALREGRGSFADVLIGALNANAGCSRTLTFDRTALRLPGFEHLNAARQPPS
jgi:predicted nucleic-acid-binding protein